MRRDCDSVVAIPVYNEASTIGPVLEAARAYACDILVVDDGSSDGTAELLDREDDIHLIRHPSNQGYGKSLVDAFNFAVDEGYEYIITMDADEQHDPVLIPAFLREIFHYDVISGSRYLEELPGADAPPPERRQINREVCAVVREVCGLDLTDAFCGYKAYQTAALRQLEITEFGYAMPLQLWVQAAHLGFRIREIPCHRIYKAPNRSFGGVLEDAEVRRQYYLRTIEREVVRLHPPDEDPDCPCPVRRSFLSGKALRAIVAAVKVDDEESRDVTG
jgi:dolichol-phosphate mannosyltransferase